MDENSTIVFIFDHTESEKWDLIDFKSLKPCYEVEQFIKNLKEIRLNPGEQTLKNIVDYAKSV